MPKGKGEWSQDQMLRARDLRRSMSLSERIFWQEIRGEQCGVRFRRQVPIGRLTLDFFATRIDLAIEIDGEQHDPESDARRDAWLASQGIEVMRISSLDLFEESVRSARVQEVWNRVHKKLAERGIPPTYPCEKPPRKRKSEKES